MDKPRLGRKAILEANQLIVEQRVEDAIRLLTAFLETRDNPFVWIELAHAYQIVGDEVVARAMLRSAVLKLRDPHIVDLIAGRVRYTKALVLDERKLLYITIPKCGSSSLKDAFILASGEEARGGASHFYVSHMSRLVSFEELDSKYADYQTISVIRRPEERLRSYWKKNIREECSLRTAAAGRAAHYGLSTMPTYEEMLLRFDRYRSVFQDFRHHTDSIVGYLGKNPGRIKNVFPIEETGRAIALIGDAAGISIPEFRNMKSASPFTTPSRRERELERKLLDSFYSAEMALYFKGDVAN